MSKQLIGYFFPAYTLALLVFVVYAMIQQHQPSEIRVFDDITQARAVDLFHPIKATQAAPDFKAIPAGKARKQAFVDYFRPLIQANNLTLKQQRRYVLHLQAKHNNGKPFSKKESAIFEQLKRKFKVKSDTTEQQIETLVYRVNEIPEAMVLAQGAIESAWGGSRFAVQGNNFFGQWCYKKGCGLVPNARKADASHEVKVFSSPAASVAAYFRNINTNRAYREFRDARQAMAEKNKPLKATPLLATLTRYSERGDAYIKDLLAVIRFNKFESKPGS